VLEIGHAYSFGVKYNSIATRYWNAEVLEELYELLVATFHSLLKQYQNQFVGLANNLVNGRLSQMLERL